MTLGIRRWWWLAPALAVIGGGCAAWQSWASATRRIAMVAERTPQTGWAACNLNARNGRPSTFRSLSDRAAAALVTHQREDRRDNSVPYTIGTRRYPARNAYVPTAAELARFRAAVVSNGQTVTRFNPYFAYVDGRDGLRDPSTDDLIQWAAHKWGIPEDWLRAEYVQESYWDAFAEGDRTPVRSAWLDRYPPQARAGNGAAVYQSLGLTQVKWVPDGSVGAGTEPLRWESTAFNVDYQAATVRFYYDDPGGRRSSWGDPSYAPCQRWNSVGGWFEPYPWRNPAQQLYVASVRQRLAGREWTTAAFVDWRPAGAPPGVSFALAGS